MHRLVILLPIAVACGGNPGISDLEEARDTWAQRGASDYVWEVSLLCFCPDTDPIEVEVIGGEVSTATRLSTEGEDVVLDASEYESWFTVEGMFLVAEDALNDADEVTVTYAEEGYPSEIDIDWLANAVDDEATYRAEDYAPILE